VDLSRAQKSCSPFNSFCFLRILSGIIPHDLLFVSHQVTRWNVGRSQNGTNSALERYHSVQIYFVLLCHQNKKDELRCV
jgi:hypothetical protein